MILALYRLAWEPALWIARALAAVERITPMAWPKSWRVSERLTVEDRRPAHGITANITSGFTSGLADEFTNNFTNDGTHDLANDIPGGEGGRAREIPDETYWLHAASLGECKGLWAFARRLAKASCTGNTCLSTGLSGESGESGASSEKDRETAGRTARREHGDDTRVPRILLTANTVAARDFLQREIAKITDARHRGRFFARLAPLDHPRVARAFLEAHSVRALILFEVELWPHWIAAARRAGVPVAWISARLTPRARRLYAGHPVLAGALGRVLRDIAWTQTQTETAEHALRRLGAPRVETGGDLRGLHALDHERSRARATVRDERNGDGDEGDEGDAGIDPALTPGGLQQPHAEASRHGIAFVSFHARELPALVRVFQETLGASLPEANTDPPLHLVVFPRKLHEVPEFVRMLEPHGFVLNSQRPDAPRVIVDAYGMVEKTLARVRTAVIGGSFGPDARIGGHNAWEPLLAGCRMVIGPHHHNQKALVEKLEAQGLIRVAHADGDLEDDLRAERARDHAHPDTVHTEAGMQTRHAREDDVNARRLFVAEETKRLERAAQRVCAFVLRSSSHVPFHHEARS